MALRHLVQFMQVDDALRLYLEHRGSAVALSMLRDWRPGGEVEQQMLFVRAFQACNREIVAFMMDAHQWSRVSMETLMEALLLLGRTPHFAAFSELLSDSMLSRAMASLAGKFRHETVTFLCSMQRVDLTIDDNAAMKNALLVGDWRIAQFLLKDPRVEVPKTYIPFVFGILNEDARRLLMRRVTRRRWRQLRAIVHICGFWRWFLFRYYCPCVSKKDGPASGKGFERAREDFLLKCGS